MLNEKKFYKKNEVHRLHMEKLNIFYFLIFLLGSTSGEVNP